MGRKKVGGDIGAQGLREMITECVDRILATDHENRKSVGEVQISPDKIEITINNDYEGLLPYYIVVMLVDFFGTQKINIGGYTEEYAYSEMTTGENHYLRVEVLNFDANAIKKSYFKYCLQK